MENAGKMPELLGVCTLYCCFIHKNSVGNIIDIPDFFALPKKADLGFIDSRSTRGWNEP